MIGYENVSVKVSNWKRLQQLCEELEPHEHYDGMNECNICDEELTAVLIRHLESLAALRQACAEPDGEVVAGAGSLNDLVVIKWISDYHPKVGDKIYAHPPAAQPAPVEQFLVACEREAAHIGQNGSTLQTKFGDEYEGRCRELCAMYLREFISAYRSKQKLSAQSAPATSLKLCSTDRNPCPAPLAGRGPGESRCEQNGLCQRISIDALPTLQASVDDGALSLHVEPAPAVPANFEGWLRSVCFQKPTPEAYDLAKAAWLAAAQEPKA